MNIDYYGSLGSYLGNYTELTDTSNDSVLKLDSMVCPCCGKKVRLVDSSKAEYDGDDIYEVNESRKLNENRLSDYVLEMVEAEARNIFENEIETNVPETDSMGNIVDDYGERFMYVNKELKKIIKVKANMISNVLKHQGLSITPYYIENELFQAIKAYGYGRR